MIALILASVLLLADGFVPSEDRNTRALQARIDAVSAQGGGTVRVTGEWTVASLKLKDGVTLHLEEGARLVASTNYADYVHTSGENRGAVVFAEDARATCRASAECPDAGAASSSRAAGTCASRT